MSKLIAILGACVVAACGTAYGLSTASQLSDDLAAPSRCCVALAANCCPDGACCPTGLCCEAASAVKAGCCPDGACCPTGLCCEDSSTVKAGCCPDGACCPTGPCCEIDTVSGTPVAVAKR